MKKKKQASVLRGISITILSILLLTALIMDFEAFSKADQTTVTKTVNNIHETNTYKMTAAVKPNMLFPDGKILHPEKEINAALTPDVTVQTTSHITSEEPIHLTGSFQPVLNIQADESWTKTNRLSEPVSFEKTCTDCMIKSSYVIHLGKDFQFLDRSEKKLKLDVNQYSFTIDPGMKAKAEFGGSSVTLEGAEPIRYLRAMNSLTLDEDQKFETTASHPVKTTVVQTSYVQAGPFDMKVARARLVFGAATLIIALLLLLFLIQQPKPEVPEYHWIDDKYRKRLIRVRSEKNLLDKSEVEVDGFDALLEVADERELPLCRLATADEVLYFAADQSLVYFYIVPKPDSRQESGTSTEPPEEKVLKRPRSETHGKKHKKKQKDKPKDAAAPAKERTADLSGRLETGDDRDWFTPLHGKDEQNRRDSI